MRLNRNQKIAFSFLTVKFHHSHETKWLDIKELMEIMNIDEDRAASAAWLQLNDIEKSEVIYHTTDFMLMVRTAVEKGWTPPIPYRFEE